MSDSVPGTYVPNMSEEDAKKFRAKHIKGTDERIEIRVEIGGANVNIFVYKAPSTIKCPDYKKIITASYGDLGYKQQYQEYEKLRKKYADRHEFIRISMNGKINLSTKEFESIQLAIQEAKDILNGK